MNIYRLTPTLCVRPHTRHLNTDAVLHSLRYYDIRTVLNVALINDPVLEAACRTVGITYRHEPMHDSGAKLDLERVRIIAESVRKELAAGVHVMIHCDSGWSRSGLIATLALYRLHAGKRSMTELIELGRRVRGQKFLKNEAFVSFLLAEA